MKKILPLTVLFAALLAGGTTSAESPGKLTVRISGLKTSAGQIVVALFDSAAAYAGDGEPLRSELLPVEETSCEWVVDELPAGEYAVKVYHDLDGNRELDRRKSGIPAEPYGFSNNALSAFGPPSFEAARFVLDLEPRTLEIELRGGRRGGKKLPSASAVHRELLLHIPQGP